MRTEANKMHKSIPLRKQETHSASLMTDLGLCQVAAASDGFPHLSYLV